MIVFSYINYVTGYIHRIYGVMYVHHLAFSFLHLVAHSVSVSNINTGDIHAFGNFTCFLELSSLSALWIVRFIPYPELLSSSSVCKEVNKRPFFLLRSTLCNFIKCKVEGNVRNKQQTRNSLHEGTIVYQCSAEVIHVGL